MKVIGFGDQVVDKYEHIRTMFPGGNALNFAVFSKKLGFNSAFVGVFGSDTAGNHVYRCISEMGIDVSHCKKLEGENGCARVSIVDGDRVFLGSNKGGVLRKAGHQLTEDDYDYLASFDLIHSSLYSYTDKELIRLSNIGSRISYDFSNDFSEEKLRTMLPHVKYAFFSTSHLLEAERKQLADKALYAGCEIALCTCGSEGAYLYKGNRVYYQKPNLVKAIDTMAAGDAFITCFILNYIVYGEVDYSLRKAAKFSSEQCMVQGSFGNGLCY